jgi:glutamyl-Q tRNA(Asp) synthetase
MAAGEPHAWRLDMAALEKRLPGPHGYRQFDREGRETLIEVRPWRWGDAVIVRKDTPTSYHLSVVVDDALQGVTHVVRGQDLEAATDLHVLLQALLGLPTPLYHHHGLILDPGGDKLAKSRRSASLAELRQAGVTPLAIRQRLGFAPQPTPST